MDGSFRIRNTEPLTPIASARKSADGKKRKPFDPEALASDEEDDSEPEASAQHDPTPVGHKPEDESGSHLDLTA